MFIASGCGSKIENRSGIDIIGHGGSGFETYINQLPANTMASFEKAIYEDNADGIEMDIQLSKDDIIVVFHDKVLNHKTDRSGAVREHLFSELNRCDFHGDFVLFSKGKHTISSLEQVLANFKDILQTKYFYFNIKAGVDGDQEKYNRIISEQIVDIIHRFDMYDNAVVETSDIKILEQISRLDSAIVIMQDIGPFEKYYQSIIDNDLDGLVVAKNNITAEQVMQAKADGKKVVIYGSKTRAGIKEILKMDPDVFQTDKIDLTKRLFN